MEIAFREAKKVVITLLIIDVLCIVISLITKTFNLTVIGGIILGFVFTMLNFFLLGTIVEKAIFKSPRAAKRYMQLNYFTRYILTGTIMAIGFISPYINPWCVVISIFAPKLTYFSIGFYQLIFKKGGEKLGR